MRGIDLESLNIAGPDRSGIMKSFVILPWNLDWRERVEKGAAAIGVGIVLYV